MITNIILTFICFLLSIIWNYCIVLHSVHLCSVFLFSYLNMHHYYYYYYKKNKSIHFIKDISCRGIFILFFVLITRSVVLSRSQQEPLFDIFLDEDYHVQKIKGRTLLIRTQIMIKKLKCNWKKIKCRLLAIETRRLEKRVNLGAFFVHLSFYKWLPKIMFPTQRPALEKLFTQPRKMFIRERKFFIKKKKCHGLIPN